MILKLSLFNFCFWSDSWNLSLSDDLSARRGSSKSLNATGQGMMGLDSGGTGSGLPASPSSAPPPSRGKPRHYLSGTCRVKPVCSLVVKCWLINLVGGSRLALYLLTLCFLWLTFVITSILCTCLLMHALFYLVNLVAHFWHDSLIFRISTKLQSLSKIIVHFFRSSKLMREKEEEIGALIITLGFYDSITDFSFKSVFDFIIL